MPITSAQLRAAFGELNGQRSVMLRFDSDLYCSVTNALLVPEEADNIVKLTDGTREYLIDAERVIWAEIG